VTKDRTLFCNRKPDAYPVGDPAPCSFKLTLETYGMSTAIRGRCTVHEGGELVIHTRVTIGTQLKLIGDGAIAVEETLTVARRES